MSTSRCLGCVVLCVKATIRFVPTFITPSCGRRCIDRSAFEPCEHGLIYAGDGLCCYTTVGPVCTKLRWKQNADDTKVEMPQDSCAARAPSLGADVQVHSS